MSNSKLLSTPLRKRVSNKSEQENLNEDPSIFSQRGTNHSLQTTLQLANVDGGEQNTEPQPQKTSSVIKISKVRKIGELSKRKEFEENEISSSASKPPNQRTLRTSLRIKAQVGSDKKLKDIPKSTVLISNVCGDLKIPSEQIQNEEEEKLPKSKLLIEICNPTLGQNEQLIQAEYKSVGERRQQIFGNGQTSPQPLNLQQKNHHLNPSQQQSQCVTLSGLQDQLMTPISSQNQGPLNFGRFLPGICGNSYSSGADILHQPLEPHPLNTLIKDYQQRRSTNASLLDKKVNVSELVDAFQRQLNELEKNRSQQESGSGYVSILKKINDSQISSPRATINQAQDHSSYFTPTKKTMQVYESPNNCDPSDSHTSQVGPHINYTSFSPLQYNNRIQC